MPKIENTTTPPKAQAKNPNPNRPKTPKHSSMTELKIQKLPTDSLALENLKTLFHS